VAKPKGYRGELDDALKQALSDVVPEKLKKAVMKNPDWIYVLTLIREMRARELGSYYFGSDVMVSPCCPMPERLGRISPSGGLSHAGSDS